MPYVLKSEVFIRGESPGEEGAGSSLFLNFQDPALASTYTGKITTLKFELKMIYREWQFMFN